MTASPRGNGPWVRELRDTGSVINGGNATIYVTDVDRAVAFYTQTLGLRLVYQAGEHWASIGAGGFEIGLHPAGAQTPAPGAAGAVTVGLSVDEPIQGGLGSCRPAASFLTAR